MPPRAEIAKAPPRKPKIEIIISHFSIFDDEKKKNNKKNNFFINNLNACVEKTMRISGGFFGQWWEMEISRKIVSPNGREMRDSKSGYQKN